MPIAKVRKDINLFIDGRGYAGKVTEFDPPKLTVKTEEYRAGGMDAPVEVDMGMEKLGAMLTLADIDAGSLKLFGISKGARTPMTLRGGQQGRGGKVEPLAHFLRGRVKEVDWGTWKPGELSPVKLTVALDYYKFELDGKTVHEIDVEGMIRIVDGVDQLEEMRKALGL